jgi:predicted alpha/beta superfamily hydrolase
LNRLLVFIFCCVFPLHLLAKNELPKRKEHERLESVVLPNTQVRKIVSTITKQAYRIYVSVPSSYHDEPKKKFPAIFMLDADYSFALAKQISDHLSDRGRIPEIFIFGIAYDGPPDYRKNRTRDYTPIHVPGGGYGPKFQKNSGGGPKFADFLEKELLPHLNKNYRLSRHTALVGHSYGGLFTSWIFLVRPMLFAGYISVSPSLWYGSHFVISLARAAQKKHSNLNAKVFLGAGDQETRGGGREHSIVDDVRELATILKSSKQNKLQMHSVIFPNENHDTVFPSALTRGLLYVFS